MCAHQEDIVSRIGEKRFKHSLRVMNTAIELAKKNGEDVNKAKIAGYYHDCAKIRDIDKLYNECKVYGLNLTKEMKLAPQIIHGYLGALIVKSSYGISDEDILNSIKYHTTGRKNMSKLEKIIFLADYIEPMRNFDGVEEVRKLANINLDEAIYLSLNNTITYLCKLNEYIVMDSIEARNYILEMNNGKIF